MAAGETMRAVVDVTVGLVSRQHPEWARLLLEDLLEVWTATMPDGSRRLPLGGV
jgi:hypothetical protein